MKSAREMESERVKDTKSENKKLFLLISSFIIVSIMNLFVSIYMHVPRLKKKEEKKIIRILILFFIIFLCVQIAFVRMLYNHFYGIYTIYMVWL